MKEEIYELNEMSEWTYFWSCSCHKACVHIHVSPGVQRLRVGVTLVGHYLAKFTLKH